MISIRTHTQFSLQVLIVLGEEGKQEGEEAERTNDNYENN